MSKSSNNSRGCGIAAIVVLILIVFGVVKCNHFLKAEHCEKISPEGCAYYRFNNSNLFDEEQIYFSEGKFTTYKNGMVKIQGKVVATDDCDVVLLNGTYAGGGKFMDTCFLDQSAVRSPKLGSFEGFSQRDNKVGTLIAELFKKDLKWAEINSVVLIGNRGQLNWNLLFCINGTTCDNDLLGRAECDYRYPQIGSNQSILLKPYLSNDGLYLCTFIKSNAVCRNGERFDANRMSVISIYAKGYATFDGKQYSFPYTELVKLQN